MKNAKAAVALFKPSPNRLETKAQTTNTAARAIIDAEAAAREAKNRQAPPGPPRNGRARAAGRSRGYAEEEDPHRQVARESDGLQDLRRRKRNQ